ncbi:MAG: TlpA family protein disulfide reductase [Planctomycetes bacterium]|nr:TlpA family protein disulfide reductase [Planctomycetota bacterium]
MVQRLKDKPFTLLGINSDSSRSALKKTMDDEKIIWPNIYGGPTHDNKIAKAWNVFAWPTIYIIDHEGVIRYKGLRDEEMEKAVNKLLERVK